jgi:hypothetical protein
MIYTFQFFGPPGKCRTCKYALQNELTEQSAKYMPSFMQLNLQKILAEKRHIRMTVKNLDRILSGASKPGRTGKFKYLALLLTPQGQQK